MKTFLASIDVMPHDNLLDPQGKAVTGSMTTLGMPEITGVRIGKHITLQVEAADKKAAEAKAKQTVIEIKEIKFRPGTDDGDYNIKMRNIKRFLDDGDKCKITLRFRGREITHQELGLALLNRIRDELADSIIVEQFPKLEGRQMIMMIAPGRKKPAAAAPKAAAAESSSSTS